MRLFHLVILLAGLSPWLAVAKEDWKCVPEQILIGEWNIEIQSTAQSFFATTYYMPDIAPGLQQVIETIKVERQPAKDGYLYIGETFQLTIFPGRTPGRNPFFPNQAAVAAYLTNAKFSPEAFLINRDFVCIPETTETTPTWVN